MFENGSLLRRRKRFKLHKPDKETLKNELQALASTMPPPSSNLVATNMQSEVPISVNRAESMVSLSPANLQRLREDLLRWEMQEKQIMLATAAASNSFLGASQSSTEFSTANNVADLSYSSLCCLLPPDPRQRLAESSTESPPPFDLSQNLSWNSGNFSAIEAGTSYLGPSISGLQSSMYSATSKDHVLSGSNTDNGILGFSRNRGSYLSSPKEECSTELPTIDASTNVSTTTTFASGFKTNTSAYNQLKTLSSMSSNQTSGKRAKKPFTIENIIAPDETANSNRSTEKRVMLTMPKPIYMASGFSTEDNRRNLKS